MEVEGGHIIRENKRWAKKVTKRAPREGKRNKERPRTDRDEEVKKCCCVHVKGQRG